ncbi:MAG TPA: WD40 repeat domain-containing protein [Thermoanaerobaculia bacterium]|nr:WD40 repeat domain-containing protein [Thermoanaerobaculia bacterium]
MKPQPRVDSEHPWPALLSFREDDQRYFGGRNEEVEALYRRIASSRLTLLFGLSGLGKSSLLLAGLFPRLRGEHYFPVYIRLRYGRDLPPPVEQIKTEIAAQARDHGVEAPEPRAGETLWQYFHRPDSDFWDDRNYPATPVLVFDQFEELFTRSREVAGQANQFIEELADLAEGVEGNYRLLIGIRSDYLAQLQGISDHVRAIFANRYELHRMSGAAALESTLTAGGHLLDEDVARRIVRFVAGAKESGDAQSVEELQVEPALLSLVCSELNATRLEKHEPKITASMLSGTKDEILSRFYEASLADISPELRVLVEDKLVTRDGKARNFISEQTARETAGVTEEDLGKLVHRRLLRFEESGSSRRMELTHDLLTAVAAASRSTREQRRQLAEAERARAEAEQREESARRKLRRSRAAMLVFFVLLAAAIAGPFFSARWMATGAKKVEADSAFRLALQKLSSEEPAEGLAYLARVIRLDRRSSAARTLLYQQLTTRTWPVPIASFGPGIHIADAAFSADGARVALRSGRVIEMWDVAKGQSLGRIDAGFEPQKIELASDGWTVLLSPGAYAAHARQPAFWNPRLGRPKSRADVHELPGLAGCANMQVFDVSPNGQELAVGCPGLIIASVRGDRPAETLVPRYIYVQRARFAPDPRFILVDGTTIVHRQPDGAAAVRHDLDPGYMLAGISRDGGRVAITTGEGEVEIRDLARWKELVRFSNHSTAPSAIFDRSGSIIMTTADDDPVRLWKAADGSRLLERTISIPDLRVADFSLDDARIFTASDRLARWWTVYDGAPLGIPIVDPKMLSAHLDAAGNIVTVSKGVHVWQPAPSVLPPVLEARITPLMVSADRKTVLVQDEHRKLTAFDTVSGKRRWTIPEQLEVVEFDSDFSRLIAASGQTLSIVEAGSWRPLWSMALSACSPSYFSRGGTVICMSATDAGEVTFVVRSAATGKRVAAPIDGRGRSLIAVSRDGSLLAFRSGGKVVIWHVPAGRAALTVEGADDVKAKFSPDGQSVVTVSARGVRVWNIGSGTFRVVRPDEDGTPLDATFSPDGGHLAVRFEDAVALCEVQTLDCSEALSHPGVFRVDFSLGGKRIATVDFESVRTWDVATTLPLTLPLTHDHPEVAFWSDDTNMLLVSEDQLRRVSLPAIDDEEDAGRLATIGEALAGARIDRLGVTEPVDGTQALATLETECRGVASPACDIVRWLRTQPEKRTISPTSKLTVTDYVTRTLKDASPSEWWRLKALFPHEPALRSEP